MRLAVILARTQLLQSDKLVCWLSFASNQPREFSKDSHKIQLEKVERERALDITVGLKSGKQLKRTD